MQLRHADTEDELRACFPSCASCGIWPTRPTSARVRMAAQRYRLLGAWRGDELALAGYRLDENLIYGSFLYVDDLVTHESSRGRNLGARLLDALTESARRAGCAKLVLDTGLSNALAQRLFPPGPADQRHALLQAPGTGDAAMNRICIWIAAEAEGSESARLSRAIVDRLVRQHPGARVIGPCGRARSPMWMATMPARWAPQGRPPTWRAARWPIPR